ncbi:MAG TPA: hypothetical protein VGD98_07955 [Ktedonobacteraceae bacterium]
MTSMNGQLATAPRGFSGPLAGLAMEQPQSWGLLDVVPLLSLEQVPGSEQFVAPLQYLYLVRVHTYGTLELQNTASTGVLIAPMHIGFFQSGAQNHATSRVILLDPNEKLIADDCFCIQQSQGGFLIEAQQRFIVLPLGLRRAALGSRKEKSFSRLWDKIETFNQRYGIKRGGHLERFLRPNFPRLLPLRHAFETLPRQVGAAYFVSGRLLGVEVMPNAACWADMGPILTMYCYGAAALQAERHQMQPTRTPLSLNALTGLDDLAQRLAQARQQDAATRLQELTIFAQYPWQYTPEESKKDLQIMHMAAQEWTGQSVQIAQQTVYLSVFRDLKDDL